MAAKPKVTVVDKGAAKLLRALKQKGAVKVGVIGSEAVEQKLTRKGNTSKFTVAQIAARHEFGVGVPRRSWLRDYVDGNDAEIKRKLRNIAKRTLQGKTTLEKGLDLLGTVLVGEIQERISSGIPPENSEMTKEIKGSSTPLIDTGQFRSSITYAVEMEQQA